jgi:hypothetical protein
VDWWRLSNNEDKVRNYYVHKDVVYQIGVHVGQDIGYDVSPNAPGNYPFSRHAMYTILENLKPIRTPEILTPGLEIPKVAATFLTDKTDQEISEIFKKFHITSRTSSDENGHFRERLEGVIANEGYDFIDGQYNPQEDDFVIEKRYTPIIFDKKLFIVEKRGKVKGLDYDIKPYWVKEPHRKPWWNDLMLKRNLNGSERYINLHILPRDEHELLELVDLIQQIDPDPLVIDFDDLRGSLELPYGVILLCTRYYQGCGGLELAF